MAAPTVVTTATTSISASGGNDPWTVNLPSGITSGDLLILFGRQHGAGNFNLPSGWTSLVNNDSTDAADDTNVIWYRWADGTEGSTLTVDMVAATKGAAIVYRVSGAINPSTQAPEVAGPNTGTGANVDPPSITPTGGSKDYLFIAYGAMDGETQTFLAPANYGNLIQANSGTAGTPGANVRLGSAERQLTASSDDPGTFTSGAPVSGWSGWTVAVHPAPPSTFVPQVVMM